MGQELMKSRYTDKSLMKAVDPNKEWCDRYEFAMAAFCGAAAGLVDAFLLGDVSNAKSESVLKSFSDERVEKVVMAYSRMLGGKANDLSGAIAFLEKKYKVNYDQRSGKDVSGMFELSAIDHHIKSLAHAPSLVGLTFSIIDQLRDTSTMFSGGKLYVINTSGGEIHVHGKGVKEKLVAAFANWLGHCMSDVAGSKGSARNGRRGMGLAMPGTEVLMFSGLKVGKEEELLGNVMTEAFRRGYDFRVGVAQGLVLGIQAALSGRQTVDGMCSARARGQPAHDAAGGKRCPVHGRCRQCCAEERRRAGRVRAEFQLFGCTAAGLSGAARVRRSNGDRTGKADGCFV